MAHRRISSAEKGKGLDMGTQLPPRSARVKVPLPDNSELLRKHTLTLIGRVTNKTVQKVWSVIPFFTEHWKTEFKPVGSDLGNGLFQFQFELESDLLSVLEQRPYHYARWMIILQRWEPTISPSFPSLIPFWVKVQGLPVHLWTEATIKCIGEDIGLYEKAEITTQTARMRVHIDGLLPLIKESVVEFPNGDEVATTLVYERLDKHCTKCLRLDHELKECLVARAEAKAKIAREEETKGRAEGTSGGMAASGRTITSATANQHKSLPEKDQRNSAAFQFSAAYNEEDEVKLLEIINQAAKQKAMCFYTLANPSMSKSAKEACDQLGVLSVDILGPIIEGIASHLGVSPSGLTRGAPGRVKTLNDAYFKRIEAIEFTIKQDDGTLPENLGKADIILVGVSRTGKTPLSTYIAQKGYKVANVPFVMGVEPPKTLFEVEPRKVFALTIQLVVLQAIRRTRAKTLGVDTEGENRYSGFDLLRKELDFASKIYAKNPGWAVIDVTNKAIEETAAVILRLYHDSSSTSVPCISKRF